MDIEIIIAIVVVLILAYIYGAYNLQFGEPDLVFGGNQPYAVLPVANTSPFSFPVPPLNIGVYDAAGNYLGSITTPAVQWIAGRTAANLQATLNPTANTLLNTALSALGTGAQSLSQLTFKGNIQAFVWSVPVNFTESV